MLTVALVGADGAGKSTVIERLITDLPFPVRRMYLGVSAESATHPLPTTRLVRWARTATGRAQPTGGPPPLDTPGSTRDDANRPPVRRLMRSGVAIARTANRITEEAYQEAVSRWHRSCGRVVIYDRFYLADFHAHDLSGRPGLSLSRRVHAAFLRRCFAEPDLLVVLDAEPEVLFARKGEGTLAELASRRAEYLAYAATVTNVEVIEADQPLESVVAAAIEAVTNAVQRASQGTQGHAATSTATADTGSRRQQVRP